MNNKGSVIPIVAEFLSIIPDWLKVVLFLSLLLGIGLTASTSLQAQSSLLMFNGIIDFIASGLGIKNASFQIFVIISFLAVVTVFALSISRKP